MCGDWHILQLADVQCQALVSFILPIKSTRCYEVVWENRRENKSALGSGTDKLLGICYFESKY